MVVRIGRRFSILAGAALVALAASPATMTGASAASRFSGMPLDMQQVNPAWTPLALQKTVTLVLKLQDDPVAVADANSNRTMTDSQKNDLAASLKAKQAAVEDKVRANGGTVLADFQWAYNGVQILTSPAKAASMRAIPGVTGSTVATNYTPDNTHGVPLIGGPAVWDGVAGLHGEGIKVAIIDTGIDYTHADFGGPGTTTAYNNALATDTAPPDPSLFGPAAPRVKGGTDLVGDNYDASSSDPAKLVTHPDQNPLDCAGHGTHTAGTAAGSGVLDNGSGGGTTYTGPYNANTVSSHNWLVGPGVAPKSDIYSIRVFGCSGSTNVVTQALDWAVAHHMDVVNMSLGSDYGTADSSDAVASNNATRDGVMVVASAGNAGHAPYLVGSPSVADGALSVAADDPTQSVPGAVLHLSTGQNVTVQESNGVSVSSLAASHPVKVVRDGGGGVDLGCSVDAFKANGGVAGMIAVVRRGLPCARVAKAIYGRDAGAVAVVMINSSNTYPPFEGNIDSNPDPGGGPVTRVAIPFLGAKGPLGSSSDGDKIVAADGGTATATDTPITNPNYLGLADFTSGGPRMGDSWLKPNVTAPGVSIASAGMGTGFGPAILSGTSMAAPHTTGAEALVKQAHPTWHSPALWQAALANTADATKVLSYSPRLAGTGLIQVLPATQTQAIALGDKDMPTVNFGQLEMDNTLNRRARLHVKNLDPGSVTFDLGVSNQAGSPGTVSFSSPQITLPPGPSNVDVIVSLLVPVATAGDTSAFHDIAGLITLTPHTNADNHGITLRVPYYMVPRADSRVDLTLDTKALQKNGTATMFLNNHNSPVPGNADFYAWGLYSGLSHGSGQADLKAVGLQTFPFGPTILGVFAVQAWGNSNNPAANEVDIPVDVNGDGIPDYVVVGGDHGRITTGRDDGIGMTVVFNLNTGHGTTVFGGGEGAYTAPFNSNVLELAFLARQFATGGVNLSSPRIAYGAQMFGFDGSASAMSVDGTTGHLVNPAKYNLISPAISEGMFDTLAPGDTPTETITVSPSEWALTPPLGLMVVSLDNRTPFQTKLITVNTPAGTPTGPSGG